MEVHGGDGAQLLADPDKLREVLTNLLHNAIEYNRPKGSVDLAVELNNLRNQNQLGQVAARKVNGQTCRQIAGAWVDESFDAKMKVVKVKALSKAYFRLLEKQPALKEVFQLGTRLVWVAPSGTALVIEPSGGKETMTDAEIDKLFTKK